MKRLIVFILIQFSLNFVTVLNSQNFYISAGFSSSRITNFDFSNHLYADQKFIENRSYQFYNIGLGRTLKTAGSIYHNFLLSYSRIGGVSKGITQLSVSIPEIDLPVNDPVWRIDGYKVDNISFQHSIGKSVANKLILIIGSELMYSYKKWHVNEYYHYGYRSALKESNYGYSGKLSGEQKHKHYFNSIKNINLFLVSSIEIPMTKYFSIDLRYKISLLPIGTHNSWINKNWYWSVYHINIITKIRYD